MLPASRAACVPVFIATPTSACASAGASLVPSPVMATRRPSLCSSRIRRSLSSGVACAMKSSTPASAAMAAAVSGLSPVIMTVRMPILRSCAKRSLMPPLTTSFSSITPSVCASARDDQRRAAAVRDLFDALRDRLRKNAAARFDVTLHRLRRAFADADGRLMFDRVQIDAAHPRLRGERDKGRLQLVHLARAQTEFLFRQHNDDAAFRRFIRERGKLRRVGEDGASPRRAPA